MDLNEIKAIEAELDKEMERLAPRTKIGKLRLLYDKIETARGRGMLLKDIVRLLGDQGLHFTEDTLSTLLRRIRDERKSSGKKKVPKAATKGAEHTTRAGQPVSVAGTMQPHAEDFFGQSLIRPYPEHLKQVVPSDQAAPSDDGVTHTFPRPALSEI
jgi:hypothetical protein